MRRISKVVSKRKLKFKKEKTYKCSDSNCSVPYVKCSLTNLQKLSEPLT